MGKKALVNTLQPAGKDNAGLQVLEVVELGDEFEVSSSLEWKDCPDTVESFLYWYDSSNNTYKKLPEAVSSALAGDLAVDDNGDPTEKYVWNWDTESWSKETL